MARILARYINCENKVEGRACGKCESCKDHLAGKTLDLIEIDAASNRGIDEIRELIEKIKFAPARSRYKVFIIDEAHMLTREAWNALLKTLEEPPGHTLFTLVTTEPSKIPTTIHSRCQRFDFKRITKPEIEKRLEDICKKEKIKISKEALSLIAENSSGGMRDAISLLDQIQSFVGKDVQAKDVQEILGLGDEKLSFKLIENLIAKNPGEALKVVERVLQEGHDLENFLKNTTDILRKLLVAKLGIKEILEQNLGEEKASEYIQKAQKLDIEEIIKMVHTLLNVSSEMKTADIFELPLELAILEYTQNNPAQNSRQDSKQTQIQEQKPKKPSKKDDLALDTLKEGWIEFLSALKPENHSLYSLIKSTAPIEFNGNQVFLATSYKFHRDRINEVKSREIVARIGEKIYKKPISFKAKIYSEDEKEMVESFFSWLKDQELKNDKKLEQEISEVFDT